MSPIFNVDFTTVDAGFPVHPKGLYRLKVTKRTPFIREKSDDAGNITTVAGVRYGLEIVGIFDEKGKVKSKGPDGETLEGKPVSAQNVYIHTPGGMAFSKSFLMASVGYNPKKEEALANSELFQKGDWTFDGDPGAPAENIKLGSSWDGPVDRLVDVFLLVKKDDKGDDQQEFAGWMPVEK